VFYFQAPNNGAPLTRGMSPGATRRGRGRSGLRVAALVSGRAAVRVLGSASLRSDVGGRRWAASGVGGRGGKGGPGGWHPEVGCGRDGRRRMATLVGGRAAARLLGSAFTARGHCGQLRGVLSVKAIFASCPASLSSKAFTQSFIAT